MESIRNSMDPRTKEKHEDSKERKKEKPEKPVIILRIKRLPA
jgi:hypothetical protein